MAALPDSRQILPGSRQIVGVDVVRFFAASIVVLFHLGYHIWAGGPGTTTPAAAKASIQFPELEFLRAGSVGVHIFFVLSGFVIAYSAKHATPYAFFRSRVVRLLPAIWIIAPITLLVLFAVDIEAPPELLVKLVRSIVLFPVGPWIDSVYWTLPIEVAFYGLVLILLSMGCYAYIVPVMTVIGFASTAFWLEMRFFPDFISSINIIDPVITDLILRLSLLTYGDFFALGVLLWVTLLERATAARYALIAFFSVSCLLQIQLQMHSSAACAIWLLSITAIALSIRFNTLLLGNNKLVRLARILGLTTYPLYLLHDAVGAALMGYLSRAGVNRYVALAIALSVVVSASVAIALVLEPIVKRQLGSMVDRAAAATRHVFRPS